MLVSIIVPVYNTELKKLNRCIQAVDRLSELYGESFECVIIDDGSEDFISNYFEDIMSDKKYITYFRQDNGGVSSARNKGILLAKGDYITFADADDEIVTENFSKLLAETVKNVDVIFSDLLLCKNHNEIIFEPFNNEEDLFLEQEALRILSKNSLFNGPVCKLIRREFLLTKGILFPEDMITGEDAVFIYRILKNKPTLTYKKVITYIYYNEDTTSTNRTKRDADKMLHSYKVMFEEYCLLLDKYNIEVKEYKTLKTNSLNNFIWAKT